MGEEESESTRYRLLLKIATGGAATVWVGAVRGGLGFRQLVAIKKPHAHLFDLPSVRDELVNEARLASMIQHGNVVDVRDVDVAGDHINLVMDYIEGASLAELLRAARLADTNVPPRVVLRIVLDACAGLHAAHDLVDDSGKPVNLVHRDVSPQNILVGLDGISRVADFGIAKAARTSAEKTDHGLVKGKLSYMAPEYISGKDFDRRADVFALGTVCWEALAGERCFKGESDLDTANRIVRTPARHLSQVIPSFGTVLDDVLATAMARAPDKRLPSTRAFASAIEAAATSKLIGTHADVAATVNALVGASLDARRAKVRAALAEDPALVDVPPVHTPRAIEINPSSDSRSPNAVAITTPVEELPSTALRPDDDVISDARGAGLPVRRRLGLVVGGISAASVVIVIVIVVAAFALSGPKPMHASGAAPPTEKLAVRSAPPPPPAVEPPAVVDPPPVVETASATALVTPPPVVTPPVAAPRPAVAPRPPVARPPAPAPSGKKPVPPNPYGK